MLTHKEVQTALVEIQKVSFFEEYLCHTLGYEVYILLVASEVPLLDDDVISQVDVEVQVVTKELYLDV